MRHIIARVPARTTSDDSRPAPPHHDPVTAPGELKWRTVTSRREKNIRRKQVSRAHATSDDVAARNKTIDSIRATLQSPAFATNSSIHAATQNTSRNGCSEKRNCIFDIPNTRNKPPPFPFPIHPFIHPIYAPRFYPTFQPAPQQKHASPASPKQQT